LPLEPGTAAAGNRRVAAMAQLILGKNLWALGSYAAANSELEEALALGREIGLPYSFGVPTYSVSLAAVGRTSEAQQIAERLIHATGVDRFAVGLGRWALAETSPEKATSRPRRRRPAPPTTSSRARRCGAWWPAARSPTSSRAPAASPTRWRVHARAEAIADPELRRAFSADIPEHARVLGAAAPHTAHDG
jgi:hypothetical protein